MIHKQIFFALNAFPHLSIVPAVKQSTAMSALRRRRTPLEEMFLDEECAMYTSRLLSCPLQPRSGNPVASTLLFQDSTVSDHCVLNCALHTKPVVKLTVNTSCYLSPLQCFLPIGLSSPIRPSPVPSGSSIRA